MGKEREGIMRPRQEIEAYFAESDQSQQPSPVRMEMFATLQLEVLLDIRDILNRIERDQPLGD
jgi:hypothetical protein